MRLIDADALKRTKITLEDGCSIVDAARAIIRAVELAPTIDPESLRPKGEWIGEANGYADGELVYDVWYCSECNLDIGTDEPDLLPNFCPNCGADMRGTEE